MQNDHSKTFPALLISLALIISASIGAFVYYRAQTIGQNLSVTGSAKQEIESDQVRWVSQFSRIVSESNLKNGYAQIAQDREAVEAFFVSRGFAKTDFTISPVSVEQIWKQNDSAPREFTLRQTVEVTSKEVTKVTEMANGLSELVNKGLFFSTQTLEYSYSKLPDLRVSLLADALKDAQARARVLAETSGGKLGTLESASSGVVQVLPLNSVEVSDYGSYDTGAIKKQVMVTVRAAFRIH